MLTYIKEYVMIIKKGDKMKYIILSVICAACLITPPKAKAINEEWSAVAGFVGGLLVANVANDSCTVSRAPRTVNYNHNYYYENTRRAPRGHYQWETRRVWVPGRWQYYYNDCGRREKYWSAGYYKVERTRVWVSQSNSCSW